MGCHFSSVDYPCARRASNQATAKSVTAARPKATLSPSIRRLAAVGGEIYAAERVLECRFMAMNVLSSHVIGTSSYLPTGDIPSAMSAFHPIASALPPAPDVGGTPGECLKLTQLGHP
jgi:hypothetical protein